MRFCPSSTKAHHFSRRRSQDVSLGWNNGQMPANDSKGSWPSLPSGVCNGSPVWNTRWMEHLLPGSCIIVHFCNFPSLAHNLIHTGYYSTEMQGYWCYRGSLRGWSAVWPTHASWIGASMEEPSLLSFRFRFSAHLVVEMAGAAAAEQMHQVIGIRLASPLSTCISSFIFLAPCVFVNAPC